MSIERLAPVSANERITTQSVGEWNRKNMKLDKLPAVFLFLRSPSH